MWAPPTATQQEPSQIITIMAITTGGNGPLELHRRPYIPHQCTWFMRDDLSGKQNCFLRGLRGCVVPSRVGYSPPDCCWPFSFRGIGPHHQHQQIRDHQEAFFWREDSPFLLVWSVDSVVIEEKQWLVTNLNVGVLIILASVIATLPQCCLLSHGLDCKDERE